MNAVNAQLEDGAGAIAGKGGSVIRRAAQRVPQMLHLSEWAYPLAVLVATLLIFPPIVRIYAYYETGVVTSDYPAFMEYTQFLNQGNLLDVPGYHIAHSAWELLSIAVNRLLGISLRTTSFLITVGCIAASALILYFWMESELRKRDLPRWWAAVAAIGLNLVTPIMLLASVDRRFYLGYIGLSSYHNPTIILLRPLAILQFILAPGCFQGTRATWKRTGLAALITLLATFAKPSYAICLLPALSLIAAYRWWKKEAVNWRFLLVGFLIPTFVMLAWQFLVAYGSPQGSGILFYPFGVMAGLSGFLGIKLLLSIFFPLLVTLLFLPESARDLRMVFAWLGFMIGAFYSYFFADSPPRMFDGDFIWSGKITLLLLFCVCTLFLLERLRTERWKVIVSGAAWIAHVAAGVVYYYHILVTQKYI